MLEKEAPPPRLQAPTRRHPRLPPGCSDEQIVLDGLQFGYQSIFSLQEMFSKKPYFLALDSNLKCNRPIEEYIKRCHEVKAFFAVILAFYKVGKLSAFNSHRILKIAKFIQITPPVLIFPKRLCKNRLAVIKIICDTLCIRGEKMKYKQRRNCELLNSAYGRRLVIELEPMVDESYVKVITPS